MIYEIFKAKKGPKLAVLVDPDKQIHRKFGSVSRVG